jgi:hypothetical protein
MVVSGAIYKPADASLSTRLDRARAPLFTRMLLRRQSSSSWGTGAGQMRGPRWCSSFPCSFVLSNSSTQARQGCIPVACARPWERRLVRTFLPVSLSRSVYESSFLNVYKLSVHAGYTTTQISPSLFEHSTANTTSFVRKE